MYADPTLIRKHVIKISLNDLEADLITAFSAYSRAQKAALLRELIVSRALEVMHDPDFDIAPQKLQRPN